MALLSWLSFFVGIFIGLRKWVNWLREDLGSRPYAWLRPDFVPPPPFLADKDPQTQSSQILV